MDFAFCQWHVLTLVGYELPQNKRSSVQVRPWRKLRWPVFFWPRGKPVISLLYPSQALAPCRHIHYGMVMSPLPADAYLDEFPSVRTVRRTETYSDCRVYRRGHQRGQVRQGPSGWASRMIERRWLWVFNAGDEPRVLLGEKCPCSHIPMTAKVVF